MVDARTTDVHPAAELALTPASRSELTVVGTDIGNPLWVPWARAMGGALLLGVLSCRSALLADCDPEAKPRSSSTNVILGETTRPISLREANRLAQAIEDRVQAEYRRSLEAERGLDGLFWEDAL